MADFFARFYIPIDRYKKIPHPGMLQLQILNISRQTTQKYPAVRKPSPAKGRPYIDYFLLFIDIFCPKICRLAKSISRSNGPNPIRSRLLRWNISFQRKLETVPFPKDSFCKSLCRTCSMQLTKDMKPRSMSGSSIENPISTSAVLY